VRRCFGLLGLLILTLPAYGEPATIVGPPVVSSCEDAGRDAERQYALPVGLLAAIGRVESGRWDAALGRVVPWPWAIDAAGQPRLADNKDAALQQVRVLQDSGVRNIDVGCFQINLQNHPSAFSDLSQAFDPTANAQYAARFLTSLRARLGNWDDAVAAYHSATPALGIPYRQLVFANWTTPEGWNAARSISSESLGAGNLAVPVKVFSFGDTQVRVWTPSRVGTAASLIPMVPTATAVSLPLPRVTSPHG
jgi:Transglycosylase SLT domain